MQISFWDLNCVKESDMQCHVMGRLFHCKYANFASKKNYKQRKQLISNYVMLIDADYLLIDWKRRCRNRVLLRPEACAASAEAE